jgi:hypothetical protein
MTDTLLDEIPQDVRALAAGIADDIERNGHYQGGIAEELGPLWAPFEESDDDVTPRGPNEPCCVVMNPTWAGALPTSVDHLWRLVNPKSSLIQWNDETPTAEVLATLRKIAAGERP